MRGRGAAEMAKASAGEKDAGGGGGKSIQRRVAKSIAGGIRTFVRTLRGASTGWKMTTGG